MFSGGRNVNVLFSIIALFEMLAGQTKDMTFNQGFYLFLQKLTGIEQGFLVVSFILMNIAIILFVAGALRKGSFSLTEIGCGCQFLALGVVLFFGTGLGLILSNNALGAFSPTAGIVDPVRFWVCVALFILTCPS